MNLMIDRIFIAVLLLSVSGFVFCAVFLPFEKYAYRLTSAKTMVSVNTAALFSFVIPFYIIAAIIDGSENTFANYETVVFEDTSSYEGFVGFVRDFGFMEYLKIIWLLGAISFLIFHVWSYFRLLNSVRANQFQMNDDLWSVQFDRLKNEQQAANVTLIGCCTIFTPCTIGIRDRYIVIPSYMINSFEEEEIEFILRHEFYHVIHRDLPRKLLITLLNCLNWFNPLYYFLKNDLSDWIEAACDEEVTKDFNKGQRMRYCQLIIKILELERYRSKSEVFALNFTGLQIKNYKRRITKIMRKNGTKGIWGKAVVASVTVLSVISGNVVAKAADAPVNQMFSDNVCIAKEGELQVIEGAEASFDNDIPYREDAGEGEFVEFQLRNTEDTTYEIIYATEADAALMPEQTQAELRHAHKTIAVTLKEHKKFSDGSCKTTYYDGKKCTICGTVWKGDVIRTVFDAKCTH